MKTILAMLLLISTAHAETYVDWVQLPDNLLQQVCNGPVDAGDKRSEMAFNGCYRMIGPVCRVYTRKPTGQDDSDTHRTLGHEIRHCFEGRFH